MDPLIAVNARPYASAHGITRRQGMIKGEEARSVVELRQGLHPEQWWAEFMGISDRFDTAYVVEELADLLLPRIGMPLLRREAEISTATVVRHLARPGNSELAELAESAATRLARSVDRIAERSMNPDDTTAAAVLCQILRGRYAAAAAAAEPIVGSAALCKVFVTGLRLEHFDLQLTLRLLKGGQSVSEAVRSGCLVGRYRWWPSWLQQIIAERAAAGTLDEDTIAALDNCAYASLSPLQVRLARKLLAGDSVLIASAAHRLEGMGERDAADRLRRGDLNTVALASRLMST